MRFYSYKVQYQVMESSCNEILRAGVGTFPVLAEWVRGFKCPAEVKERENDKELFPVLKTFVLLMSMAETLNTCLIFFFAKISFCLSSHFC